MAGLTLRERARLATQFMIRGDGAMVVSWLLVVTLAVWAAFHGAWVVLILELALAALMSLVIRRAWRRDAERRQRQATWRAELGLDPPDADGRS